MFLSPYRSSELKFVSTFQVSDHISEAIPPPGGLEFRVEGSGFRVYILGCSGHNAAIYGKICSYCSF